MADKDDTLEAITLAFKMIISESSDNIVSSASRMHKYFPGLDWDKLPEYKKAIDAIDKYKEAAISRFTEKYNAPDK